ncbi:hypothetical protein C0J52_24281, partial [Blattella germanica]
FIVSSYIYRGTVVRCFRSFVFLQLVYFTFFLISCKFSHHDERESFSGLHSYDKLNNRDLVVTRYRLMKPSNSHIVMSSVRKLLPDPSTATKSGQIVYIALLCGTKCGQQQNTVVTDDRRLMTQYMDVTASGRGRPSPYIKACPFPQEIK